MSQKIIPARRKAIHRRTRFKTDTSMRRTGGNDKAVARSDLGDSAIYRKPEPATFDIGGLNMAMIVQRPLPLPSQTGTPRPSDQDDPAELAA